MIGFVAGVVLTGYCPVLPSWPVVPLLIALSLGILAIHRSATALFVGGITCGCALGFLHGSMLLHSRLSWDCVGEPIVITGRVSSLPSATRVQGDKLRQRFEFSVATLTPQRCAGPQTLALSYFGEQTINPGSRWQFEVKLKRPWGLANPGSYNLQAWFAQHGIDGVGNVRETARTHVLPAPGELRSLPGRLRQKISHRINAVPLDADVAAVLRAITVADSAGIDANLWYLFQQFGLNHLLVISGLHIGMIAAVAYLSGGLALRVFPGLSGRANWLPGGVALLLAAVYTALAGFSIPTQRALSMLACFVLVTATGRASSSTNNLLFAATAVLLLNPLSALGNGFWLSFGAVGALLWFSCWQRGRGVIGWLLSIHAGMSLMMLPLGALFFGGASIVSLPANLLMIPVVGWLVVPVALLAAASFLLGCPLDSTLWQLAGYPLRILLPQARSLAQAGGDWLYMPVTSAIAPVVLGTLSVLLVCLPGKWTKTALAIAIALPLLLPAGTDLQPESQGTRITVLDVGQGTAVVVQSGDRVLLYDTGGGDPQGLNMANRVVLPYLKLRGISALDTLVISHRDLDHSAGTATVLAAMPVGRLRFGQLDPGSGRGRACIAGESWRWPGGPTFQFLSPALGTAQHSNDRSCVLRIQIGDYYMLLPGDIDWQREQALVAYWGGELHSDWLLAAHHGSQTSSSLTFLKRARPEVAVISAGYANRFGHPHPDVVRRMLRGNVGLFSTEASGALEFEIVAGKPVQLAAYRQRVRRYWM